LIYILHISLFCYVNINQSINQSIN